MENNETTKSTVDTANTVPTQAENAGTQKKDKPNFSEEQQKYIDDLINKQYAKIQATADKKLKDIEQAERLKGMSDIEQANEKLKLAEERLAEYAQKELVNQFKVELTTKGLKAEFAELIPVNDADKAKKAVDVLSSYKSEIEKPLLEKIKELEEQVRNATLRGQAPKVSGANVETKKSIPTLF